MSKLRFASLGAGFWSKFQLAGWREVGDVECVAIYNRTRSKAEEVAREFGIPTVYDDPAEMLRKEKLDFVDIITAVESHAPFIRLALEHGVPIVCQKPFAASFEEAVALERECREKAIPLFINENWRWQTPIRALKSVLDSEEIGRPFRARIDMISGFPVFQNQPFLKELKEFILTDLGSHILDVARFLFGEARTLYCQTHQVHRDIQGEDVATVMMTMESGVVVLAEMAYAGNYLENDNFPRTAVFVEGEKGSIELTLDFNLKVTTKNGTEVRRVAPKHYSWADPAYDVVHASIVPCQADILRGLRGDAEAETTAADNLKTVRLVHAAYESARKNRVQQLF